MMREWRVTDRHTGETAEITARSAEEAIAGYFATVRENLDVEEIHEPEPLPAERVEELAQNVFAQVQDMQRHGVAIGYEIRPVPTGIGFGDLHDIFDANVGWGDELDGIHGVHWIQVQNRVDELMRGQS